MNYLYNFAFKITTASGNLSALLQTYHFYMEGWNDDLIFVILHLRLALTKDAVKPVFLFVCLFVCFFGFF